MYSETTHPGGCGNRAAEVDPDLQLRHVALACVGRLLFSEVDVEPLGAEQTYLYVRYDLLRHIDIPQALHHRLTHSAGVDAHIVSLVRLLGLSDVEVLALVLAMMVEEEPMIGRVLAHIQMPVGGSRPALGLLEAALAPLGAQDRKANFVDAVLREIALDLGPIVAVVGFFECSRVDGEVFD